MTGVEAVSNGVMAFGEPRTKNAQRTLTVIIGILMILLFGITWLAKKYQIMPMDPNSRFVSAYVEEIGIVSVDRQCFAPAG